MEVKLDSQPFDIAFHPSSSLMAAGLITGHLQLFSFDDITKPESLWTLSAHSESCRAVRFANDGQYVLTASPDCSILATNVETGQPIARLSDAHGAAINRLINLTEATVASGDDDGKVKVWDTRQNTCCNSYNAHEDYIADMEFVSSTMQLLSASGDGTLSVCNLHCNKVDARSEFSEDELLSVVLIKNGRKVICGSQEGVLFLYSWGYFKDCSDRFLGHPKSIDTMLKLDEDSIITGSSDGLIRIISILPNKIIGVIGEHADFPIERLAFSNDMKVLGSASHDHTIKLWDINYLIEDGMTSLKDKSTTENEVSGDDFYDVEKGEKRQGSKRKKRKGGLSNSQKTSSSFFEDLL